MTTSPTNGPDMKDQPWAWLQDTAVGREVFRCLQEEITACNVQLGWADDGRRFGEDIALVHSEASEGLEEFREHGFKRLLRFETATGYSLLEEGDPNADRWIAAGDIPKPEGVASEMADIVIRVLDVCSRHDIDLYGEMQKKIRYNWTREYRHGGKAL